MPRTPSTIHKTYTKLMIAGMILHVVKSLNNLPSESGLTGRVSPAMLISVCSPVSYDTVMKLNYGDYVQAHECKQITND